MICLENTATSPVIPETERVALAAVRVGALLSIPLMKDGTLVGNLTVSDSGPHHWTPAETAIVKETAERTWAALERARTESALRDSEERYRTLFDSVDEGFCICEVVPGEPFDLRYLAANPAFERHSGLADPVGRTLRELVPGVEESIVERYRAVAINGEPDAFVSHVADLDRWMEVEVVPAGPPGQLAFLFRNVTQRKRTEEMLRANEQRQAYLLRLSDALRPLNEAIAVQRRASQILRETLGADRVSYAELDADEDTARLMAEDRAEGIAPFAQDSYRWSDFDPAGHADARAGRTVARDDVETPGLFDTAQRAAFAAVGFRAFINVPLVKSGRLVAFIAVHFGQARVLTDDQIAMAEETAERTWAAVERVRAEAALRASEERLALRAPARHQRPTR